MLCVGPGDVPGAAVLVGREPSSKRATFSVAAGRSSRAASAAKVSCATALAVAATSTDQV